MIKFGTGGWRAIIGEEFTKENIQKLALAMSLKIKAEHVEDKPVVIGYDRRLSKEAVIWSCEIFGQRGNQGAVCGPQFSDTAHHVLCDEA